MTVLHTVACLHADAGGPSRTVSATCAALAEHGVDVEVVTTDAGGRDGALLPPSDLATTTFAPSSPALVRAYRFRQVVEDRIRSQEADLVHDHGVWLPTNYASYAAARNAGIPLVVTTRGMLEPWALNHRRWKKKLAWSLFQHRILQHAALLHATAGAEADQLRELGLETPVVVTPNGVPLPDRWKQSAPDRPTRRALFLSRIHPKKGLLNLVDAWAEVRPDGWRLVIAGPDENDHRAEVERRARRRGIDDVVSFPGPIPDDEKWDWYRKSDLFVLPTFSENFGVVVAEALAAGIPAITTTGAPWQDLETEDCGWWIDTGVDPLVRALRQATDCTDDDRLAMGRRGRRLVKERYSWDRVAADLQTAYQWILGRGPQPDCVRLHSASSSHASSSSVSSAS